MAEYGAYSNKTNTVSATVPMFNLVSQGRRLKLNELIQGCDAAPGDQAIKHALMRTSARGTQSTSVTPNPKDPADIAANAVYDTAWSVDPTITANSNQLQIAQNQRATFRWQVNDGKEIIVPASSGAGLAFVSAVATGVANYVWQIYWTE